MSFRFFLRGLAGAAAALALAAVPLAAQAGGNVYWSLGVEAAPGVSLGVSNTRPVLVQPAPVIVQPAPVVVYPRPVYVQPQPVYVQPAPVVIAAPYAVPPGHWKHRHKHKNKHGHKHGHGHGHGHDD